MDTRETALLLFVEMEKTKNFGSSLIRDTLNKYDYEDPREKAFLKRLTEGTLESLLTLDYVINAYSKTPTNKMKPLIRSLLRLSVYQILYMDTVPDSAACNEAVRLAKKKGSAKSAAPRLRAAAVETRAQLFSGCESELAATDPELIEIFDNFTFAEVLGYGDLDVKTRMMCILASCIAGAAQTEFRTMLEGALNVGVTPVEAKEVVYQAVPYVGMARTVDFVHIVNGVLTARGVALPLEGQSATSPETRFEKGLAVQKAIFGERIDAMRAAAPENQQHIQDYLSANCFGDYVSRGGLDAKVRELLTFSMLLTLGGCEPQLRGHIQGNLNVGNDKRTLLAVVTQLLPYAGYPRTLNAIACLNEAIPENE